MAGFEASGFTVLTYRLVFVTWFLTQIEATASGARMDATTSRATIAVLRLALLRGSLARVSAVAALPAFWSVTT
jgi:hypothetical protein